MRPPEAAAPSPGVQLAIADFTIRSLRRQLRAAHRLNVVLAGLLVLDLAWKVLA